MFKIKRTVGYSHIGTDGFASLGSIVDFMQDCGNFQMNEDGLLEYFRLQGMGVFFASWQIDVKRYPIYGERLSVNTGVYLMKNLCGYRNFVVYDEKSDLCVSANVIGVFVNLETGKPSPLLKEGMDLVKIEEPFPMEYAPRKIDVPPVYSEKGDIFPVRKYHLDSYNHVNNGKYIIMAEEYLPEGYKPGRVRTEYKNPAKLGCSITPFIHEEKERRLIALLDEKEKPYALVEFSI